MFAIDAREQAPLSSNEFMFSNRSSLVGGLASGKINIFIIFKQFESLIILKLGIPGEILGFWEAYKIGGRLPWKDLFVPTITMCRNGFFISKALASAIKANEKAIRIYPIAKNAK